MTSKNPSVAWSSKKCPNVTVTRNIHDKPAEPRPIKQQIPPDEFTVISLWQYYYVCLFSTSDLALLASENACEDWFFLKWHT